MDIYQAVRDAEAWRSGTPLPGDVAELRDARQDAEGTYQLRIRHARTPGLWTNATIVCRPFSCACSTFAMTWPSTFPATARDVTPGLADRIARRVVDWDGVTAHREPLAFTHERCVAILQRHAPLCRQLLAAIGMTPEGTPITCGRHDCQRAPIVEGQHG